MYPVLQLRIPDQGDRCRDTHAHAQIVSNKFTGKALTGFHDSNAGTDRS
ncbi:hypothetical protein [Rhizobium leguminosarum]